MKYGLEKCETPDEVGALFVNTTDYEVLRSSYAMKRSYEAVFLHYTH
jgi:hypothetical protein